MSDEDKKKTSILKHTKLLLTAVGAAPINFRKKYIAFIYNAYFWICCAGTVSMAVIHIIGMYVFVNNRDWDSVFEGVSFVTAFINVTFKITLLKKELLTAVFKKVEAYERIVEEDAESNSIYQRHVTLATTIGVFYTMSVLSTLLFMAIGSMFLTVKKSDGSQGRRLIVALWFPIDIDQHYPLAFFSEAALVPSTIVHFLSIDVFVFSLFTMCIAQFRVVQHRLRNLTSYKLTLSTQRNISVEAAETLLIRELAMLHIRAIDMTREVDTRLKMYFFVEFIVSSFRISLGMLKMLWKTETMLDYIAMLSYIGTLSIEVYLYYWNANEIEFESSQGIYTAAAYCDYHQMSPANRKTLTLILTRANVPSAISVGNVDKMSVNMFIRIVKMSYYYVSLLNHFHGQT